MTYKYLDHEADVGFEAAGDTLEEVFCEGAKATFGIMVDLKQVSQKDKVEVKCEADSIPNLFVAWLNELLSLADMEGMFFSGFKIFRIMDVGDKFMIEGTASGETIDPKKHTLKTEAKAATYYGLKYEVKEKKHILQAVIDV